MDEDFEIIEADGLESDLEEEEKVDLFNVLTDEAVMMNLTGITNIVVLLRMIMLAVHGEDVRGAIHDALLQTYHDASISDPSNSIMEVIQARGEYDTLALRLDAYLRAIQELSRIADDLKAEIEKLREDTEESLENHEGRIEKLEKAVEALEKYTKEISDTVDGHSEEIKQLQQDIEDLYKLVGSLQGGSYTYLTPGVDFDVTFFNGFYTDSGYIRVGYIETTNRYTMRYTGAASDGTVLQNADLQQVTLRHTNGVADVPASWIFGVNFKGEWAFLNDYSTISVSTPGGNGIWNVRPLSERGSWQATISLSNNTQGYKTLASITQYADGYNNQFSRYSDGIYSTHINISCEQILYTT